MANCIRARNINFATVAGLAAVLSEGSPVRIGETNTLEIRNQLTILARPQERCLILPFRQNDIFASIAETMWVLAGRNDIGWLQRYLPRASDYSDDGEVWRAGYGPRLRRWPPALQTTAGTGVPVDQIKEIVRLLSIDRSTRQAVMVLYDPARDFVKSKDIPCNNWLHWIIRDGRLYLNVVIRSNDIVWGFSGINAFEWSILHEILARWLQAELGEITYFATSFHLYEKHYIRAQQIIDNFPGVSCYDFDVRSARFETPLPEFDDAIQQWFVAEETVRLSPDIDIKAAPKDPLLRSALQTVRLKWGIASGWPSDRVRHELAKLPENGFTAAAYELLARKESSLLQAIPQPNIAKFFDRIRRPQTVADWLPAAVKALHRSKNAAYGNSWKKRGELVSILPNIARKIDRLQVFATQQTALRDEAILDTTIDLLVYCVKYLLFIAETDANVVRGDVVSKLIRPYSDDADNFDVLFDTISFVESATASKEIEILAECFEKLCEAAENRGSPEEKAILIKAMMASSSRLATKLCETDKAAAASLRAIV